MRILFLCTGNSARSQMAEGLARHLGKEKIEAHSAGIEPKGLNPLAVTAMDEMGMDIRGQQSKGIDDDLILGMDWVVTVCGNAEDRCPVLPGSVRRLHWPLEDPAAAEGEEFDRLVVFKKVRDELQVRLRDFLAEILP